MHLFHEWTALEDQIEEPFVKHTFNCCKQPCKQKSTEASSPLTLAFTRPSYPPSLPFPTYLLPCSLPWDRNQRNVQQSVVYISTHIDSQHVCTSLKSISVPATWILSRPGPELSSCWTKSFWLWWASEWQHCVHVVVCVSLKWNALNVKHPLSSSKQEELWQLYWSTGCTRLLQQSPNQE